MQIKKLRHGLFGVVVGAAIVLTMQFLSIGSSTIRMAIFLLCAVLLPFLIEAWQNKSKADNK